MPGNPGFVQGRTIANRIRLANLLTSATPPKPLIAFTELVRR